MLRQLRLCTFDSSKAPHLLYVRRHSCCSRKAVWSVPRPAVKNSYNSLFLASTGVDRCEGRCRRLKMGGGAALNQLGSLPTREEKDVAKISQP